jgi:hypothetical protein
MVTLSYYFDPLCTPKTGDHMTRSEWSNTIVCFNSVTPINQIGSFRMLLDRFYWNWLQNVTLHDRKKMLEITTPSCSFCDISGHLIHQAAYLMVKTGSFNLWRNRANHWKEDKINIYFFIHFFVGNKIVSCSVNQKKMGIGDCAEWAWILWTERSRVFSICCMYLGYLGTRWVGTFDGNNRGPKYHVVYL